MEGDFVSYDLVVIGSGPGGYVASIRAAQLGMKVLCVEKEASFGGTCLNVGCIPSKALLESSDHFFKIKNEWKEHGINASEVTLGFDVMQARKNKIVTQLTGGIRMLLKKNKVESKTGTACINKDKSVTITSGNSKETVQAKISSLPREVFRQVFLIYPSTKKQFWIRPGLWPFKAFRKNLWLWAGVPLVWKWVLCMPAWEAR